MDTMMTLDESTTLIYEDFLAITGLSETHLHLLVDAGLILPLQAAAGLHFYGHAVPLARRARRLLRDFDLNDDALVLVLLLLARIDELEETVRRLEAIGHSQ